MNKAEYERTQAERRFTEWAVVNKHNVMSSYPRSGRNYLSALISKATGRVVVQGVEPLNHGVGLADVFLFVAHLDRWKILGDKGTYILLLRDPRDCILSDMYKREVEGKVETVEELVANRELTANSARMWTDYFSAFLKYGPHIVQYERLCLSPIETLEGILEFLNVVPVEKIPKVIRSRDMVKPDVRELFGFQQVVFASGAERYNAHCLKWQRDPLVGQGFLDTIWGEAGEIMQEYGYLQHGHSVTIGV